MTDRPNNQDANVTGSVHPGEDELSAYINGDITDLDDLQRLHAHLETCASCRETLSELRTVVWMLRRAENPVPSRSFRLDPSMVGAQVARIDPWIVRIQPALRRLTAVAAVLLLFVVVADVLAHQNADRGGTRSVAESAAKAQTASGSSAMSAAPAISASTSASSSGGAAAQAIAASPAAVSGAAADTTKASQAATPVAAPAAQAGTTSPSPTEQALPPTSAKNTGTSYWRLVELAAGVVVIWLLFLTVALPRLVRQREP